MRFLSAWICALALMGQASTATAAIIATESFSYANGDLNGLSGGTGWTTSWNAGSGVDRVASEALVLEGNNDDAAFRSFASQSGDNLFFAFTFTFHGELGVVPGQNDFIGLWIDNGTSNGLHIFNVANIGLKSNFDSLDQDFFVRLNIHHEQFVDAQANVDTPVQMVGMLEKIDGEYRKFSLWVNEIPGVLASFDPQAVAIADRGFSNISRIGFRTANLDSSPLDSITIDSLAIGTTLLDVLDPPTSTVLAPEPASMAVWTGIASIAALCGYRRRKA